jgi:5,5'-dehydrodivanillate O-demethylase
MLTAAKNELLTRVGPGTAMGELLRRYWMPVGGASEFDTTSIKPIRLMGEDLVLYKDLGGKYGLVDRHCPHRRADLSYGWVESNGIRCSYHGWLIDETGRCIEQPYEDTANAKPAKDNCGIKGLPGAGDSRFAICLHGAAAGPRVSRVGAFYLGQRLS